MENTPQQAIVPLEQPPIPFHAGKILAVHLPDNRVAATLNSLCNLLGILRHGQARRIQRDKDLAEYLLLVLLKTARGTQRTAVLIDDAIPLWVMKLHLDQIALEKREYIVFLKMEAVEVLRRHFFSGPVAHPMAEPHATPVPPPSLNRSVATSDLPWDRLFEGLGTIQEALHIMQQHQQVKNEQLAERFARIEERLTSLDQRVAGINQGTDRKSVV